MEVAMAIHHPAQPDIVLLREGAALDAYSIPHLQQLGVHEVWIRYPGLEHLVRFVDPQLMANYRALTSRVGNVIDQAMVRNTVEIDFYACKKALLSVTRHLAENPQSAVWVSQVAHADKPFVRHCGNVAALSLMMGMRLDFYLVRERKTLPAGRAKDLTSLGIGALLHDVGMLRLPQAALERYNASHDTSDPEWRTHAALGYDMVRGVLDPTAAIIALHHHQAWDGTGFPERPSLRGGTRPAAERDVHVFARIVAAAEMFSRIKNPAHAPGSNAKLLPTLPTVRALKLLLADATRKKIDPVVFKALMSVVPAYAPGSVVKLSDGRDAVVTTWDVNAPCRPVVEILHEFEPRPHKQRGRVVRVDLREQRDVTIVATDGEDVSQDNYDPAEPGEFDLVSLYRSMENRAHSDLKPHTDVEHDAGPASDDHQTPPAQAA
jgi:HD-GYP domain-containing protein (c-di-GMP phosphodiesterase class II)